MRTGIASSPLSPSAGCSSSSTPNADRITGQNTPLFASQASEAAPPVVFNTQMRSDIEVPACASESQGHAQIKILQEWHDRVDGDPRQQE